MITTRQHLVSAAVAAKVTNGRKNTRKKVCIHETGNQAKGSRADNHARLQANGNSRNASWHWTVDDKEAVQSFTHDYQCWAAGTKEGNNEAIHIEMCVNADGDYRKTVQNTAQLVAQILVQEGLTINDIVQHNHYSGKNCPQIMRSSTAPIPWHSFVQMVKGHIAPSTASPVEDKQPIKDAPPSDWAKEAVEWAKSNNITDGTWLQREATREEIITMLYRFVQLNK